MSLRDLLDRATAKAAKRLPPGAKPTMQTGRTSTSLAGSNCSAP